MERPPVHPSPCQLEEKILQSEGARRDPPMPLCQKDPGLDWAGLGSSWLCSYFCHHQTWSFPPSGRGRGPPKSLEVLHRSWSRGCPVKAKCSPGTTVTTFPWGTSIMGCPPLGTSGRRCHGLNTRCSPKAPVNAGIFRGKLIRLRGRDSSQAILV